MTTSVPRTRVSAGIVLYRLRDGVLEVLLGHPGGPYFTSKDAGYWSIPKGEVEPDEDLLSVAIREFGEETGHAVGTARLVDLGSIVQKGGKVVHAWAVEGDLNPASAKSNMFRLEWPPRSGLYIEVPEVDQVAWFDGTEARRRIKDTQIPLIERLEAFLAR